MARSPSWALYSHMIRFLVWTLLLSAIGFLGIYEWPAVKYTYLLRTAERIEFQQPIGGGPPCLVISEKKEVDDLTHKISLKRYSGHGGTILGKVRIPVKSSHGSGANPATVPGQAQPVSERSDAEPFVV